MRANTEMLSSENHELDWVCPACGSDDCEMTGWVHVNSNEICEGEGPGERYWCPECQDHPRRLVQRRDFESGCSVTENPSMSAGVAVEMAEPGELRTLDLLAKWPYGEAK